MTIENENNLFKIEHCRTKIRAGGTDLFDCLALHQVKLCLFALPFGEGYFCQHPDRHKLIGGTGSLHDGSVSQSDTLDSADK